MDFRFLAALAFLPVVAAGAVPSPRTSFSGSIRAVSATGVHPAQVVRTTLRAEEHAAAMSFEVALKMRNFDQLQARLAQGERIATGDMEANYYPLAADHDRVVQWLQAQGLKVTRTDSNRLAIFGRGSVDAVAQAFGVTFARVSANGGEYTSAVTSPSLPADIASAVLGIHGLQPHLRPHRLATPKPRASSPGTNAPPYLPAQIAHAYSADTLGVTGSGQTIAIYAFAYPQMSDLSSFWQTAGVAQSTANVQTVNVAGGPASASYTDGYGEEATLDTEWSGALAPGAALRIYGASEDDPADNDEILQQVFADLPNQPHLHQLCICIGGNEEEIERDYLVIEAQYMANLASAGVSVFSASGDAGAKPDSVLQTTWPTSDPDVTGVGGTTLTLASNGSVSSETGWSLSGGGISDVFARPAWQTGTGVPAGTMRLTPDVAAFADPNTGAVILFNGKEESIGGTSVSAPVWSGFCALLNQSRANAGQSSIGLLNSKIYALNGTASFRDITSGGNSSYSAGPGYDMVTGIGTPNMSSLIAALQQSTPTSNSAPTVPAQLGNRVTVVGQPATFFVTAVGAQPISYQWRRMPAGTSTWVSLSDNGTYAGSATPMLVVSGTTLAMSGDQFQCVAGNSLGSATSAPPAALAVNPIGVTTLAGWPGSAGVANGTGWAARFDEPGGVRADIAGNVFVADSTNNTVRRITPAGVVTTLAGTPGVSGSANGPAASALFNGIGGVAPDANDDVYVADSGNYTIRMISEAGTVTTLAGSVGVSGHVDGNGTAAEFSDPQNLAVDPTTGNLYVADGNGNTIRKVTPSGVVTTFAGSGNRGSSDGTGAAAQFNDPTGLAVDYSGNVYVADYGNNTVRKITPAGVVTTLAGRAGRSGSADGTGTSASFSGPTSAAVDLGGNVYVSDAGNDTVREIAPAGVVTTLAGSPGITENIDGLPLNARFATPGDIAIDGSGVLYLADSGNDTIRRLVPGTGTSAVPPAIVTQPQSETVTAGSNVELSVYATGTAPLSYQWFFDGIPLPGESTPIYTVNNVQAADSGAYAVTVTNQAGSVTSATANVSEVLPPGSPGVSLQSSATTLAFDGSATLTVSAAGNAPFSYQWLLDGSPIPGATSTTYVATAPGSYVAEVTNSIASVNSSPAVVPAANRLVDVSTRAYVSTGDSITIAGIVIDGPSGSQKQVLIRGVGPALQGYGVTGTLGQPTISLFNSAGAMIATNTGWGNASNASQMPTLGASVGDVIPFTPNAADSALLLSLSPGAYTVQLSGAGGTSGEALVEIYEADTSDANLMADISTRALVESGQGILIAGFVVQGSQPATVLIRGSGPALGNYGVTNFLAQPVLIIVNNATGQTVATNTGWGNASNASQIPSVAMGVGSTLPFTTGSNDSALLLTLPPGSYSAEVSSGDGTSGVALVEVYEAPPQ